MPTPYPHTLREKRVLFTRCLVDLLVWVNAEHPEWEIALDEVTVHTPRAVWHMGEKRIASDAVHVSGSFHHEGLAADLLLYIGGKYVTDGEHPAWREIAAKWESLHSLATSGRRFKDSNHVSLGETSKAEPLP